MIESLLCCHFHILVGIFHYRTWLVYSNDGLPQNALGLREQASWMHTHLVSFVELSYIYSSSASVAWQSLLTHIDIYWWASPYPVDYPRQCETFSFFCLLHTIPIIIFYSTHSAISMAHAHVLREDWKSLRTSKVWNNCLACHRGCAWFKYFVWWRWSIARLYDFVGITFFGHVILRRHNCLVSMLEVLLFLCQYELLSWIFRIRIFMP